MRAPHRLLTCRAVTLAIIVFTVGAASAQSRVDRRLNLSTGSRFVLDTDTGAVSVTGDSTSGATVTIASDRSDFEQRVHVPKNTVSEIRTSGGAIRATSLAGNTRLRTSGGSLDVSDIQGRVEAETSGGSISVRQVTGDVAVERSGGGIDIGSVRGAVRAHTSGGSIRIDAVTGVIDVNTSGGGINVTGAGDRVDAHTSGGSVTVSFVRGNNRGGTVSTSGGGLRVELDPTLALTLDASSSGGGVSAMLRVPVRGEMTRRSLRGTLNGGGPVLELRSSGGGIRISDVSGPRAER